MKDNVIIYRESFWQSVLADSYTFGGVLAVLAANHFWFGDGKITYFVLLVMVLLSAGMRGLAKKHTFVTKEAAIEYLNKL